MLVTLQKKRIHPWCTLRIFGNFKKSSSFLQLKFVWSLKLKLHVFWTSYVRSIHALCLGVNVYKSIGVANFWADSRMSPCYCNEIQITVPANIYLFKVSTRKRCEICSKWAIKIPVRRRWRHSGVFVVNFEHI